MILKYAYAYASPNGTFYVGYKDGVVTHTLSANVLSSIASSEGTTLSHLRRLIKEKIGTDTFELVNVTPKKITDRGIVSGEEIKELYDTVKFDEELQAAAELLARKLHQEITDAFKKNYDPVKAIKAHLGKLVDPGIKVDVKADTTDPSKMLITFQVPMIYIQFELPEVKDGT